MCGSLPQKARQIRAVVDLVGATPSKALLKATRAIIVVVTEVDDAEDEGSRAACSLARTAALDWLTHDGCRDPKKAAAVIAVLERMEQGLADG